MKEAREKSVLPQKRGPECPTPDVVYYSWADIDTKYSITEYWKLSESNR